MADDKQVDDVVEAVEIDLSAVPEKHRQYIEPEKYQSDAEYKRAVEHGYNPSKEAFIEAGGDPDLWMSAKKFNRTYDERQERKALKAAVEKSSQNVETLMKTFEQQREADIKRAIAETESRLKQAKDDGDVDGALALRDQLAEQKQQVQQQRQPEPIPVRNARRENPILDPMSDSFNREVTMEFEQRSFMKAKELSNIYGRQLSDYEIRGAVEETLHEMRDKIMKPVKPTIKAPVSAKPTQKAVETDPLKRLDAMQKATYERLLAAPKAGGKEAAERYLKAVTQK